MRLFPALLVVTASCGTANLWIERDADTRVLCWAPIVLPEGAESATYELVIYEAEQGLPRGQVHRRIGLTETRHVPRVLAPGEYVWTVRARYRHNGREWATRWRHETSPVVPPLALAANPAYDGFVVK